MIVRRALMLALVVTMAGCVTGYTLVQPGVNSTRDLQVTAGSGWNLAPAVETFGARAGAQTWTKDGVPLDRLVLIPAVADGETLVVSRQKDAALPVFRKDMLPNEIEELVESTLVKYFGEGNAVVSTANLRPHTFGDDSGVIFEIEAKLTDSPDYRGKVGAFVVEEKLYTVWYIAADPHYYTKHEEAAAAIIVSARLATP